MKTSGDPLRLPAFQAYGPQLPHVGIGGEVGPLDGDDGAASVRVEGRFGDRVQEIQITWFHGSELSKPQMLRLQRAHRHCGKDSAA